MKKIVFVLAVLALFSCSKSQPTVDPVIDPNTGDATETTVTTADATPSMEVAPVMDATPAAEEGMSLLPVDATTIAPPVPMEAAAAPAMK